MKTFSPIPTKGKTSLLRLMLMLLVFFTPVLTSGTFASTTEDPACSTTSNTNTTTTTTTAATVAPCDPTATTTYCGVTDCEIVKYLGERGYEVYSLQQEPGTCNVIATTQYEFLTRVFIENGCIIKAEDF